MHSWWKVNNGRQRQKAIPFPREKELGTRIDGKYLPAAGCSVCQDLPFGLLFVTATNHCCSRYFFSGQCNVIPKLVWPEISQPSLCAAERYPHNKNTNMMLSSSSRSVVWVCCYWVIAALWAFFSCVSWFWIVPVADRVGEREMEEIHPSQFPRWSQTTTAFLTVHTLCTLNIAFFSVVFYTVGENTNKTFTGSSFHSRFYLLMWVHTIPWKCAYFWSSIKCWWKKWHSEQEKWEKKAGNALGYYGSPVSLQSCWTK